MTDFEPETDFQESVDADDRPVDSAARLRDATIQSRRKRILQVTVLAVTGLLLILGLPPLRVLVAMAIAYVILIGGMAVLGAFARPVPEPPPPGELRRVKLTYRCPTCGTELRMTLANDRLPQAPRHCSDEMELTTAAEDL